MVKSHDVDNGDETDLIVKFDGGRASDAGLPLDRYAASLKGWSDLFRILGQIYQNSIGDLRHLPNRELLLIDIRAERRGSFESWILIATTLVAGGVIQNRSDALIVWTCKRLTKFFAEVTRGYVDTKKRTSNVDTIVAALERLTAQHNVMLELAPTEEDVVDGEVLQSSSDDAQPRYQSKRLVAEKIDSAIREATLPLDADCTSIDVLHPDGRSLMSFDQDDRDAIKSQLELPLPDAVWAQQLVRFERINRKTGRALIYFGGVVKDGESASYAIIVDPAVHKAGDPYTAALSADQPLLVWSRQVRAERGRLNLMWEITVLGPAQFSLFGPRDGRA